MPFKIDPKARGRAARTVEVTPDSLGAEAISGRDRLARSLVLAELLEGLPPGYAGASEAHVLARQVQLGLISREEAARALVAAYPARDLAGGATVALAQQEAEQALAEMDRAGDSAGLLRALLEAQRAPGGAANAGTDRAAGGDRPLYAGRLPMAWEPGAAQRVLDALAEDTAQALRQLRVNPPEAPVHSIDGGALRPGTVPADALARADVERSVVAPPGPDEAIIVYSSPSSTSDRWVVDATTGEKGPGRIRDVHDLGMQGARVSSGVARYRIVRPGQRYSILNARMDPTLNYDSSGSPGFRTTYGAVLRGIPHTLGRIPRRIWADAVGDDPLAFRGVVNNGGVGVHLSGASRFFWDRAKDAYHTSPFMSYLNPYGTDSKLYPSIADAADCRGVAFMLITGRDGEEVFQQLCSRACLGESFRATPHGPFVSLPEGEAPHAPVVPSALFWNGSTGSAARYTHLSEADDLSTQTRLVQGPPFSYDDCASLVPTADSFSLAVWFLFEEAQATAGGSTWASAQRWPFNGVETTEARSLASRSWALDILVE